MAQYLFAGPRVEGVASKEKSDKLNWAQGRLVAIRPDGARKSFNPEATMLLRTDAERASAAKALHRLHSQVKARPHLRPEWLKGSSVDDE